MIMKHAGLLLPAGIALAYASKDLSHNFLAGESYSPSLSFTNADTLWVATAWEPGTAGRTQGGCA